MFMDVCNQIDNHCSYLYLKGLVGVDLIMSCNNHELMIDLRPPGPLTAVHTYDTGSWSLLLSGSARPRAPSSVTENVHLRSSIIFVQGAQIVKSEPAGFLPF